MEELQNTDKKYTFREIHSCEMCKDNANQHKTIGQRLNQSQGLNPRNKKGISVSIVKCTNCGLLYSNPQPIPMNIQDHYGTPPEEYWKEDYFTWSKDYFKRQIDKAKVHLGERSSIKSLDIGAGLGKAMLSMEHNGFEAYGLEPSIPFYERAISKMGIKQERLILSTIEQAEYENETFDFITFGAVFEHLYQPSICLERALSWLKKDGILHLEVPSADWLIPKFLNFYYKLIGTNYTTNLSPMHSPFHLHEFTTKSFDELAKMLNYTIVESYYDVCTIYHVPKILHPIVRKYMQKANKGMQLTIFMRKL